MVPVPDTNTVPTELVALCGQVFAPGRAERLDEVGGMPCVECMVLTATSAVGEATRPEG